MKNTSHRKKLIELFEKNEKAYSADEIAELFPEMNITTIYRNLNRFVEEGIIREISINKDKSLYEVNHDDHQHAICTECGKIKHVDIKKNDLLNKLKLEGFEVEDIDINIKGHCKD